MANEEHLKILEKGVRVWNRWRKANPEKKPDLSNVNFKEAITTGADLRNANFSKADLSESILRETLLCYANLSEAILSGADLSETDLSNARLYRTNFSAVKANPISGLIPPRNLCGAKLNRSNLTGANLTEANLCDTELRGANLRGATLNYAAFNSADLREADLSNAYLERIEFGGANLSGVNLSESNLRFAFFMYADLSNANLYKADLKRAKLQYANLTSASLNGADIINAKLDEAVLIGTDLSNIDLRGRDFTEKDLRGVNLYNVKLQTARLLYANLDEANLTGACLWEAQLGGWSIKGVICEYVYWDKEAKEITYYQPGDFERLFCEQKKIKLFYKDGANLLEIATLPSIIKNLEEKHPGCKLSFQSIEETSGGAIATLVLEESKDIAVEEVEAVRALIQADAERDVQALRLALESKDKNIAELRGEVQALDRTIDKLIKQVVSTTVIGDTYNISGQIGAAGRGALAHDIHLNQIVNEANSEVKTQIQGERNIAIDGDAGESSISTGDKEND
jgi:uncharacterized protein YjbI with pentapeptide repeats